jgi:light-regulated signal transduction histidine kinase (bacteriophytochrome)
MLLNARKMWREGNQTERVLLAIEDITERKRIEDELLRSNEDLQRFAYVAAHDLRSPLNAALNTSKLLARRLEGRLDQEEWTMLGLSVENMERLAALMHDVLTYSLIAHAPEDSRGACRQRHSN